jgi:hypothetical protein
MGTFAETAIVDYCSKENKLPFAAKKWKFAVFLLQQTNGSYRFPLIPFSVCGILETWRHGVILLRIYDSL